MSTTKVYEVVRYHTLNEHNQIETPNSLTKLNEATFIIYGMDYPLHNTSQIGKLKKVTLTINVEDYQEEEEERAPTEVEVYPADSEDVPLTTEEA